MAPHFLPAGVVEVADHADFATFGVALTGQHFDKLTLAVAGHAGDADDFPASDDQ